jgi:hypothetical protein
LLSTVVGGGGGVAMSPRAFELSICITC